MGGQSPYGNVYLKSEWADTALLYAAATLKVFDFEAHKNINFNLKCISDRFARSEDLIRLLLDSGGASGRASNTVGLSMCRTRRERQLYSMQSPATSGVALDTVVMQSDFYVTSN